MPILPIQPPAIPRETRYQIGTQSIRVRGACSKPPICVAIDYLASLFLEPRQFIIVKFRLVDLMSIIFLICRPDSFCRRSWIQIGATTICTLPKMPYARCAEKGVVHQIGMNSLPSQSLTDWALTDGFQPALCPRFHPRLALIDCSWCLICHVEPLLLNVLMSLPSKDVTLALMP